MAKIDVAILLRCKSRTWQLEGALNQCLIDLPEVGITPHVILMPDKPSIEVLNIVEAAKGYKNVHVVAPPKCDGHRWAKTGMGGLNVGMEYIDANLPFVQWVWFHDDDELLGIGWRTHLKKCLEDTDTLAWLAVSLYI